jgi:hypothetical protein
VDKLCVKLEFNPRLQSKVVFKDSPHTEDKAVNLHILPREMLQGASDRKVSDISFSNIFHH